MHGRLVRIALNCFWGWSSEGMEGVGWSKLTHSERSTVGQPDREVCKDGQQAIAQR